RGEPPPGLGGGRGRRLPLPGNAQRGRLDQVTLGGDGLVAERGGELEGVRRGGQRPGRVALHGQQAAALGQRSAAGGRAGGRPLRRPAQPVAALTGQAAGPPVNRQRDRELDALVAGQRGLVAGQRALVTVVRLAGLAERVLERGPHVGV